MGGADLLELKPGFVTIWSVGIHIALSYLKKKKEMILINAEFQARNYFLLELKVTILERGRNVLVCLAFSDIWSSYFLRIGNTISHPNFIKGVLRFQ